MAKWADYLISHVRKNNAGGITQVLLHEDFGETVGSGSIKTEAEVITLLKKGQTVKTIMWRYPRWLEGANVSYIKGGNGEFLRTDRDKTAEDNLDNMIPLFN
jgi:hypothetical protein